MTETIGGRAVSSPIPGSGSLSQLRDATVTLQLTSLNNVNERALAFGSAASSPATYGALHGAVQQPLADSAPLSLRVNHGAGGFDATVTVPLLAATLLAMVASEHLYACLFAVDPAISGSVPDLVIDLGVIS